MGTAHQMLIASDGLLPETIVQRDRILTDGGVIVDLTWVNRVIRTLKAQGIYTSCKFLADANFGYKDGGSGLVSTLYDISGNNNDVLGVTTTRPTWTTAQQGGKAGIVFTRVSSHRLTLAAGIAKQANFSLLVVIKPTAVDDAFEVLGATNSDGDFSTLSHYLGIRDTGKIQGFISDGTLFAQSVSTSNGSVSNATALVEEVYTTSSGVISLYVNGGVIATTLGGTGAITNEGVTTAFSLGRKGAYDGNYFGGSLMTAALIGTDLSTAQRQAIEGSVNSYYAMY